MFALRVLLPVAILVAGLILIVVPGTAPLGLGLVVVAPIVWLLNWLMRLNFDSQDDRAREQQAREHFTRTGRWPDDS